MRESFELASAIVFLAGLVLIALVILIISPSSTPTPTPELTPTPTLLAKTNEQAEYYRAIFDLCMFYGRKAQVAKARVVIACFDLVDKTKDKKWFETKSPDWKWPIPSKRAEQVQ